MSVFAVAYDPANYMEAAFAPAEAKYKAQVMWQTWGHLEPKAGTYPGYIVFTYTMWGDMTLIDADFEGVEMCPLLFDHLNEFVDGKCETRRTKDFREKPPICPQGGVYRFDGTYTRFKNMNGRFSGRIVRLNIGKTTTEVTEKKDWSTD